MALAARLKTSKTIFQIKFRLKGLGCCRGLLFLKYVPVHIFCNSIHDYNITQHKSIQNVIRSYNLYVKKRCWSVVMYIFRKLIACFNPWDQPWFCGDVVDFSSFIVHFFSKQETSVDIKKTFVYSSYRKRNN